MSFAARLASYLSWCVERGLDPLAVRRPHLEPHTQWMQKTRWFKPSTIFRRFPVTAGFHRTCFIDGAQCAAVLPARAGLWPLLQEPGRRCNETEFMLGRPGMPARFLKWAGFTVMALSTLIAAIFAVGETFTDPGGWKAAGLIAAWAIPLAVLAVLAWYRPGRAVPVFAVLTAAVIGVSIWLALSPRGKGPTDAILTFALAAVIAVLGLKRTGVAGVLLLIVGIVPFAVSSLVSGHGGIGSLAAVSLAPIVAGVLYLLSANVKGGRPAPSARTGTGPGNCRRRLDPAGLYHALSTRPLLLPRCRSWRMAISADQAVAPLSQVGTPSATKREHNGLASTVYTRQIDSVLRWGFRC